MNGLGPTRATSAAAPIVGIFRLSEADRWAYQSQSFQWLADNRQGLASFSFYRIAIHAKLSKEGVGDLRIGAASMAQKKLAPQVSHCLDVISVA
jgi:hypothetical protein